MIVVSLQEKEFNIGVELLRIVLMIVVLHILSGSGSLEMSPYGFYRSSWGLELCCISAVDCFALISGYVGVNSSSKITGIVKLWMQVFFYSEILTIVYALISKDFNLIHFIKAAFPVIFNQYWYFTVYFVVFFFTPFFNIVVNNLEQKGLQRLVGSIVIFFSILPLLCPKVNPGGYSVAWISLMYVVGACIRKNRKFNRKINKWIFVWSICIILNYAGFCEGIISMSTALSYTSPLVLFAAISLFKIFESVTIKQDAVRKVIIYFLRSSFSAYLLHTHPLLYAYFFDSVNVLKYLMGGVLLCMLH